MIMWAYPIRRMTYLISLEETGDKLDRLGSKLATKSKDQRGKWLFLNYWSKTVKMTKPQRAKRKFTLVYI
ncbi:hypothetical protein HanLR1_Chr01g0019541 [Helianthus annuus]|nr:hypothetical protein HanLR1_Chr01g0019541 [Helianthus annuus]